MHEIKLVYQQIKEYIEGEAKEKKPGEPLSSEVKYSELFGVSRPTVRKAVDELIAYGLVKRIPGKGLAVANPGEYPLKSNLIFLIPYIPDDGFFFNMVMGCVDAANKNGFSYKIINNQSSSERLRILRETDISHYSGIVLAAYVNPDDSDVMDFITRSNIRCVLVDNPVTGYNCPFVITDDFKGGYIAGEYLIKKGHRKVVYLTLEANNHTVRKREEGIKKAFKDFGLELPEEYIIRLKDDNEAPDRLSSLKADYTAICGYSDLPVIMSYNYLLEKGVKIPQQVSLMGYGNFNASALLTTPLSTVGMPVYEMGSKACEMLVENLQGKRSLEKLVLDVGLVERSSVVNMNSTLPSPPLSL